MSENKYETYKTLILRLHEREYTKLSTMNHLYAQSYLYLICLMSYEVTRDINKSLFAVFNDFWSLPMGNKESHILSWWNSQNEKNINNIINIRIDDSLYDIIDESIDELEKHLPCIKYCEFGTLLNINHSLLSWRKTYDHKRLAKKIILDEELILADIKEIRRY